MRKNNGQAMRMKEKKRAHTQQQLRLFVFSSFWPFVPSTSERWKNKAHTHTKNPSNHFLFLYACIFFRKAALSLFHSLCECTARTTLIHRMHRMWQRRVRPRSLCGIERRNSLQSAQNVYNFYIHAPR